MASDTIDKSTLQLKKRKGIEKTKNSKQKKDNRLKKLSPE